MRLTCHGLGLQYASLLSILCARSPLLLLLLCLLLHPTCTNIFFRNVPQRHRRPSAPCLPALHSDVDSSARLPPSELLVQQEPHAPSWLQGENLLAHDAAAPAEPHQDKRQQVCGLHHPRRRSRGPRVLMSPVPTRLRDTPCPLSTSFLSRPYSHPRLRIHIYPCITHPLHPRPHPHRSQSHHHRAAL